MAFAAGLLLTSAVLSPHPSFVPLAGALALTGAGIGWTVVPITSSVLGAVPPERSGMAASAANTSREIGAVAGVAVLGALVNAQLHAALYLSAGLVIAAGILTAITLRSSARPNAPTSDPAESG